MRKKTNFDDSLQSNMLTYNSYVKRITELALSRFKWNNLPSTCDSRYLELGLFEKGQMLFFNDDVMGYLSLNFNANGQFDVYNYPISRVAYANNGYYNTLSNKDSVIVYNNFLFSHSIISTELRLPAMALMPGLPIMLVPKFFSIALEI